jgi:hypothetical protein
MQDKSKNNRSSLILKASASLIVGLMVASSIGLINSSYTNRYPTVTGKELLFEMVRLGLSNPYSFLDGVLVSALMWRIITLREQTTRLRVSEKSDYVLIALCIMVMTLGYLLMTGIIIY